MPSEAEGFGLPVVEALACGIPVIASDLPVLREVGGEAVEYRRVGDVSGWAEAVLAMLSESPEQRESRRINGFKRARMFSWLAHTERLAVIYRAVIGS